MDKMMLGTNFSKGILNRILSKLIKKKLGIDIGVDIITLDVEHVDGERIKVSIAADAVVCEEDTVKLLGGLL
ncbi:MAG: hypothetical protein MJZ20_01425 [Bacteroidaceae bacterium]|nr:hypothetical protein [Bacteroidaceae bacterium]